MDLNRRQFATGGAVVGGRDSGRYEFCAAAPRQADPAMFEVTHSDGNGAAC